MKFEAIIHRSSRDFIYPISRKSLKIRLLAAREDLSSCEIIFWDRRKQHQLDEIKTSLPLTVAYRTAYHDDFRACIEVEPLARFMRYVFKLIDKRGNSFYYNEYGFNETFKVSGFFEHHYTNEEEVVQPPAWARGIVYYQIFPDRFAIGIPDKQFQHYMEWNAAPTNQNYFGGDLPGIIAHLDHLSALGVECLYLNPIFQGDFNHKYATTDYYSVAPEFGSDQDLIDLVSQAHQRGIRVILDGVFNHCGHHFPQFLDFQEKGCDSQYADWFLPYSFTQDGKPDRYEGFEDFSAMPKLRTANPEVRKLILDILCYWVEKAGIDGWRLDVADEIELQTLQIVLGEFRRRYPDKFLLAETWTDAIRLVSGGDLFHATMNYAFRNAVLDFIAFRSIDAQQLDHRLNLLLSNYPDEVNDCMFNLLDSHDTPRFLTEAGEDKRRLMLAVALQMTYPGCPSVYYGDEIGISGAHDPDCRRTMKWDRKDQDTDLFAYYQRLIKLRSSEPALQQGSFISVLTSPSNCYAFTRILGLDRITIVLNNAEAEMFCAVPVSQANGQLRDLLTGEIISAKAFDGTENFINHDRLSMQGKTAVKLPAMGFAVLKEI